MHEIYNAALEPITEFDFDAVDRHLAHQRTQDHTGFPVRQPQFTG
jgi:hypothetical protein